MTQFQTPDNIFVGASQQSTIVIGHIYASIDVVKVTDDWYIGTEYAYAQHLLGAHSGVAGISQEETRGQDTGKPPL